MGYDNETTGAIAETYGLVSEVPKASPDKRIKNLNKHQNRLGN